MALTHARNDDTVTVADRTMDLLRPINAETYGELVIALDDEGTRDLETLHHIDVGGADAIGHIGAGSGVVTLS